MKDPITRSFYRSSLRSRRCILVPAFVPWCRGGENSGIGLSFSPNRSHAKAQSREDQTKPTSAHSPRSSVFRPPGNCSVACCKTIVCQVSAFPPTDHRPPSTVLRPPPSVLRPPPTAHRPPSTAHRPPSSGLCSQATSRRADPPPAALVVPISRWSAFPSRIQSDP